MNKQEFMKKIQGPIRRGLTLFLTPRGAVRQTIKEIVEVLIAEEMIKEDGTSLIICDSGDYCILCQGKGRIR